MSSQGEVIGWSLDRVKALQQRLNVAEAAVEAAIKRECDCLLSGKAEVCEHDRAWWAARDAYKAQHPNWMPANSTRKADSGQ